MQKPTDLGSSVSQGLSAVIHEALTRGETVERTVAETVRTAKEPRSSDGHTVAETVRTVKETVRTVKAPPQAQPSPQIWWIFRDAPNRPFLDEVQGRPTEPMLYQHFGDGDYILCPVEGGSPISGAEQRVRIRGYVQPEARACTDAPLHREIARLQCMCDARWATWAVYVLSAATFVSGLVVGWRTL
jgi:hypothetical protein